ncbi:MAG: hypothetical protein B6I37_05915 [Desulfobacteraceae bacterium 4572_35.2]|nr:MAG: hypothetical protein B6I37_05915 [Desulfobacteraceae bacterium 4572_35.2]
MKRLFIVMILLTVMIFFLLISSQRPSPSARPVVDLTQGRPLAPDFKLLDIDGDTVSLSSLRGKVVLVNFWATWCPPCREEIPSMERLYQLLHNEGLELLAINVEVDGRQTVPKFVQRVPFAFPVLFDGDGTVRGKFGVSKYPETFIIDSEGVIRERVIGGIDWSSSQMITYLRSLLKAGAVLAE